MKKFIVGVIIFWLVVIIGATVVGVTLYSRPGVARFGFVPSDEELDSLQSATADAPFLDEKLSLAGASRLTVDLSSENVRILAAEDGDLRVVHYGVNLAPHRMVEVVFSGSEYLIQRVPAYNNSGFNMGFHNISTQSNVDIYLPASYGGSLKIDMSSGNFNLEESYSLDQLDIKISSGNVRAAKPLETANTTITMTSGNINLAGLTAKTAELGASSGRINLDAFSGSANIDITSGNITLDNVELQDSLDIQASSGTVNVYLLGEPSLDFRASLSSGNVKTYFPTSKSDRTYTAKVGDGPYKTVKVSATSGTINIGQA